VSPVHTGPVYEMCRPGRQQRRLLPPERRVDRPTESLRAALQPEPDKRLAANPARPGCISPMSPGAAQDHAVSL